jgi:Zn-dependent protease with chaperone function
MNSKIELKPYSKEDTYFFVKAVFSIIFYFVLAYGMVVIFSSESISPTLQSAIIFYAILLLLALFIRMGYYIGYLKGNAIKVTYTQFPDIAKIVSRQSELLELHKVPDVYIVQSGGLLNALTTNFFGTNYIVLFSEIVESAYEQDKKVLEFVIGHELGHIKHRHMLKRMLLLPSGIIPFLNAAYSRACEYTCDNIGYTLCPEGARSGLLLMASGRLLFKNVNVSEFINQNQTEAGFWKWFAEKLSSHPNLTKRLARLKDHIKSAPVKPSAVLDPLPDDDYTRFMPRNIKDN